MAAVGLLFVLCWKRMLFWVVSVRMLMTEPLTTANFSAGAVVPMPTLPVLSVLILSFNTPSRAPPSVPY
jgi:hypothetical protein